MKSRPELKIVVSNAPPPPAAPELPPEQVEMPFAVVNGEPISQLTHDLYIPPQALEVFLEAFEGPLDLLLYLIPATVVGRKTSLSLQGYRDLIVGDASSLLASMNAVPDSQVPTVRVVA